MKRSIRRGFAGVLAAFLMIPAQPSMLATASPVEYMEAAENQRTGTASASNAALNPGSAGKDKKDKPDAVFYNTGSFKVCVVKEEDAESIGEETMVDVFDGNGDYTIPIPEMNPFFPYEVQFSQNGKTESRWFMNPEDSVTIGGHTFYVKAEFDGTAVTQMSLKVGEDTVVVYPEKKEFTDNGGIMPLSLLPLEERRLNVDLTGYTPVELTMVYVDSIFMGNNALADTDQVMWSRTSVMDYYWVTAKGEYMDLSQDTYLGGFDLEMIVGSEDQLDASNIRYLVHLDTTKSEDWLIPTVHAKDSEGKLTEIRLLADTGYTDPFRYLLRSGGDLDICVAATDMYGMSERFIRLKLNEELFKTPHFDHFKVYRTPNPNRDLFYYQGPKDPEWLEKEAEDITDDLFTEDGVGIEKSFLDTWLLMTTYDFSGNITGCMPFKIWVLTQGNDVSPIGLSAIENGSLQYVNQQIDRDYGIYDEDVDAYIYTLPLKYGYAADGIYHLTAQYSEAGEEKNEKVTAAYVGLYDSVEEAKKAGAQDIKDSLLAEGVGYAADYSKTVFFTVFIGEYESVHPHMYRYHYGVKTEAGVQTMGNSTYMNFDGLRDADGNSVNCYVADTGLDSYGEENYLTIFADKDADLTRLAPTFRMDDGVQLYAEGSSTPEVSGKSFHDFSRGPVQYTASAENGRDSKNYWLHVIKAEEGSGKLYISSLSDQNADTKEESGVIYSTREILLDGRHGFVHYILIANVGTEAIENLSAELESDEVEFVGDYWTLKGKHALAGLNTVHTSSDYGELPNLAELHLYSTAGPVDGREIKGTLTIKSGETILMVLTLTGVVGDPGITTLDIPDAIKYVPYGTMIQNSNKYGWNEVRYSLTDGELPGGMELRQNGELYGVPTETGDFTFTVGMENGYEGFMDSERTFTLTVTENTDANVEAATDDGYHLTQRIQDITLSSNKDQTLVSEGEYDEFVDAFLDGVRLTKGMDYVAEPGSTRITIRSQTLKAANTVGTHTLGVEFRTKDTNTLKRAAQNYKVTESGSGNGGGNGSDRDRDSESSSGSSGSGRSSGSRSTAMITRDPKKGYVHALTGIITGTGNGYSRWIQDETGWKLLYADGTYASGHEITLEDGSKAEQVLWEKINNSWFVFGADGYLRSGWIYDYQLGSWYGASVESGMRSGWYTDPQDNYTYYLDPETGKLTCGWKNIENSWYYFNAVIAPRTWEFDEGTGNWYYNVKSTTQPYGSLYRDTVTPDGYQVNADGVWTEN